MSSDVAPTTILTPVKTEAELRFDESRRKVGIVAGPLMFLLVLAWPFTSLSPEAHRLAAVMALVIVFYSLNLFQSRDRVSGLLSYYGKIRKKTTIAASRTEVWSYSLRTICRYPISGVGSARWKEEIPSGYRAGGRYDSHNVFLEYGRSTGVMGMVLIAMFFFYPVWSLGKHRSRNLYLPFYMAYFSMFIFWMVLSYAFYKPFWALWIMMSMMSLEHRALFMQSATRNRK